MPLVALVLGLDYHGAFEQVAVIFGNRATANALVDRLRADFAARSGIQQRDHNGGSASVTFPFEIYEPIVIQRSLAFPWYCHGDDQERFLAVGLNAALDFDNAHPMGPYLFSLGVAWQSLRFHNN